jgi:aconitate hydratase
VIFARKPGDGSAREQAASCQRVLGGIANIAYGYATKRYRSNLINWGMLPFTLEQGLTFPGQPGDWIYVPEVRARIRAHERHFPATLLTSEGLEALSLSIAELTRAEEDIICSGCLMNYYAAQAKERLDA